MTWIALGVVGAMLIAGFAKVVWDARHDKGPEGSKESKSSGGLPES